MKNDHDTDEPYRQGGARIQMRDGRVTAFQRWLGPALGGAAVLGVYWLIGTVVESTRKIDSVLLVMQQQDKHLEATDTRVGRVEDDVKDLRRDVSVLEGRNMRGGPEASRAR